MTLDVAFLSAGFPWPPSSGGGVRTLMQLRVLASVPEVARIRMFALHEGTAGPDECRALEDDVPKLEVAPPVFHPIHLLRHRAHIPRVAWLRIARGRPYMAAKWDSAAVAAALESFLARERCDVVWLNGLGMAYYLGLVRRLQPRARVVLDQQNVEHDRFTQFAQRQRGVRRLVADAEARAARRYEHDVLRAVDAVGAISIEDQRAFRALADVDAVVVPQLAPPVARGSDPGGQRLCWIGGLAWEPNVRGIDWFCASVWPRVRERLPEATLDIIGPGLPLDAAGAPVLPAAWRAPGVTAAGFVRDLAPVYARSVAMVAPILGGTGIRIKLVEALRHGLPFVTTPDGAAGLAIAAGREGFIESDADAFADRVVELVRSPATRERMRDAGRRFLEENNRIAEAKTAVATLLGVDSTSVARASQWRADTVETVA